ncbi:hypothetical protein D8X85_11320 [Listeria seeligeri]|nr:hypothetical protein [Listeria seeligeri]MBM5678153.1 hypothetical protein [Listeria seeligeri]
MKRKTEKSHETLRKITVYPPKLWLIYSHKLTTSKYFHSFPLFRMKIPNSLFDRCGLLPFSASVFLCAKIAEFCYNKSRKEVFGLEELEKGSPRHGHGNIKCYARLFFGWW